MNDMSPFTVISPTVAFKTLTLTVVPETVPADMVLVEPVVMFPIMFILPTPEILLALRSKLPPSCGVLSSNKLDMPPDCTTQA